MNRGVLLRASGLGAASGDGVCSVRSMNPETERIFEQLVVERGLVSADQMAEVRRLQDKAADSGDRKALLDVLIEWEYGDEATLRELAGQASLRSGAKRTVIGGFELLEKVGQGGMGAVYRARQVAADRIVALKLMKPKLAKDTSHLERFLREAKASGRLKHPNIVQGIDAGCDSGYYYFALEFVDGETLRKIIFRDGAVPEQQCLEIGMQMARALEHAWGFGMVHRDIKPANIMIEQESGTAKLADLGLAKSTQSGDPSVTQLGIAIGTPYYINPEQARGEEDIDVRSDIYSLGATLYHAATATMPFRGESAPVVMSKHLSEPPEPPRKRNPDISEGFSAVILKMMEKDREDRYQKPVELLADLELVAEGRAPLAAAPCPAPAKRAVRSRRLRPATALIGAAVIAIVIAATALIYSVPTAGRNDAAETNAAIFYARACDVVAADPTNFDLILKHLRKCIDTAPEGPSTKAAGVLMKTTKAFMVLGQTTAKTPAEWVTKATALTKLMANIPKKPPYAAGIRKYLRDASRKHMAAAMNLAVADPIKVPEASAWLDAIIAWAPDKSIVEEAKAKKTKELAAILRENGDYILDTFAKRAATATEQKQFAQAVAIMRSSVPAHLMTPQLRQLIDKRVAIIHQTAERELRQLQSEVWSLLDGGDLDQAARRTEWGRTHLRLPHLERQIDALHTTAKTAADFLPLLDALGKLEASAKGDLRSLGAAALDVHDRFGKSPYVADKLKKYEAAIRWQQNRGPIATALEQAGAHIAGEKHAEAEAVIAELLSRSGLTTEERTAAHALRMRFRPEYVLARRLSERLAPKLPIKNMYLNFKNRTPALRCNIVATTEQALTVTTKAGKETISWNDLKAETFYAFAVDKLKLLPEDDAYGRCQLAALLVRDEHKSARDLVASVIALAEDQPSDALPGRTAMLASAHGLLNQILESEAATALKNLTDVVRLVDRTRGPERAIAAHSTFEREYGATRFVVENATMVGKVETALVNALLKKRTAPVMSLIQSRDWRSIITRLGAARDEAEGIALIPPDRQEVIDSLIDFGRNYLAEEHIYRQVFSSRPWQGKKLVELMDHKNELIARRAARYSPIFKIRVGKSKKAMDQLKSITGRIKGSPAHVTNTRLARCDAVFRYWPRRRTLCARAELRAAMEFARTAILTEKGKAIQNTGDLMLILTAQNSQYGGDAGPEVRAEMEYQRLAAYARAAGPSRSVRLYVVSQAMPAMLNHRDITDFPARFCLIIADQYLAAGDLSNAYKYYDRLCSRTKYRGHVWRGYLGRGRVQERRRKYNSAVSDYQSALARSTEWWDTYACTKAITDLCVQSGKFDRPAAAKKAVGALLRRVGGKDVRRRRGAALALLKKEEAGE